MVLDGKYRIHSVIGQGGLGIVFAGEQLSLGREVAIKFAHDWSNHEAGERLLREAQILAALQHPNICDIYDASTLEGFGPYLVTQRIIGETIAARLKWQRFIPAREAIDLAMQVLSALHTAHARHVVHRDVKPQNVFIVDRVGCGPIAKVLDFGFAKDLSADRRLTRPGKALGTLAYMAPEQLQGDRVTPAADLFSLGIMLYEMLTGRHPFHAATSVDMQVRILRSDPSPLSTPSHRIDPAIEAILLRTLEKRPLSRYPDAHAMQRALAAIAPTLADDPPPASSRTPM